MKTVNTIIKLLSALAAVAGAVYIIATYGEQITAWAKKTLASLPKCPCCKDDTAEEEAPAEEAATECVAGEACSQDSAKACCQGDSTKACCKGDSAQCEKACEKK